MAYLLGPQRMEGRGVGAYQPGMGGASGHMKVSIPNGSMRLCPEYGRGGQVTCRRQPCALHICHSYLAGFCSKGNCFLSHDIMDSLHCIPQSIRGLPSMRALEIIGCSINMREVIASTFPRICTAYNTPRGCQNKSCHFIHVCRCLSKYDQGLCNEPRNHNLFTPEIIPVLKKYGLPLSMDYLAVLRTNILCPDAGKPKGFTECSCAVVKKEKQRRKKKKRQPEAGRVPLSSHPSQQDLGTNYDSGESDSDNEFPSVQSSDEDLYNAPATEPKILNNLSGTSCQAVSKIEFREKVRPFILQKGGLVRIQDLVVAFASHFPSGFDIAEALKSDQEIFRLSLKNGVVQEVSTKEQFLICGEYNSAIGCINGDCCCKLHVCIDYVAGTYIPGCMRDHGMKSAHTLRIFRKAFIEITDPAMLLKIVRNNLPQICAKFNESGECPYGDDCKDLHVCEDVIFSTCKKKSLCVVNHSITSPQCCKIMKYYDMMGLKKERMREVILPYRRPNTRQRRNSGDSTLSDLSTSTTDTSSVSGVVKEVRTYLLQQGGFVAMDNFTKEMTRRGLAQQINSLCSDKTFVIRQQGGTNSEIGVIIHGVRICGLYNREGNCTNADCKYLHICRNYIADNCSRKCTRSHDLTDQRTKATLDRLGVEVRVPVKILYVLRNSLPQICRLYNDGACNFGNDCRYLHICEQRFFRSCNEQPCLNHDIGLCRGTLAQFRMSNWDNNKLKSVVLPCKRPSKTKQNVVSLVNQEVPVLPCENLYQSEQNIISPVNNNEVPVPSAARTSDIPSQVQGGAKPKTKKRNKKTKNQTGDSGATPEISEPAEELRNLSLHVQEPSICEANLRGICPGTCGLLHHLKTYMWQYQSDGIWRDFSGDDADSIESIYCKVDEDKWSHEWTPMISKSCGYPFIKQSILDFAVTCAGIAVQFSMITWSAQEAARNRRIKVPVRRLGTLSYIDASPKEISTKWKWFYKDQETMWTQPEESLQLKCEEAYMQYCRDQAEGFLTLKTLGTTCCIDFQNMILYVDNSGHEGMDLRRRPEFISQADLECRLSGRFIASASSTPAPIQSAPSYPPPTPPTPEQTGYGRAPSVSMQSAPSYWPPTSPTPKQTGYGPAPSVSIRSTPYCVPPEQTGYGHAPAAYNVKRPASPQSTWDDLYAGISRQPSSTAKTESDVQRRTPPPVYETSSPQGNPYFSLSHRTAPASSPTASLSVQSGTTSNQPRNPEQTGYGSTSVNSRERRQAPLPPSGTGPSAPGIAAPRVHVDRPPFNAAYGLPGQDARIADTLHQSPRQTLQLGSRPPSQDASTAEMLQSQRQTSEKRPKKKEECTVQ